MSQSFHYLLREVGIEIPKDLPNRTIENISSDSRRITKGSLFIGLPGERVDGGCFWPQALSLGAAAAIIGPGAAALVPPESKKNVLVVNEPLAKCLGYISSAFWGNPSGKMSLIGVTGTNGKTTITYLIEHLSKSVDQPCALFGTLVNRWPMHNEIAINTTEFADTIQRQLFESVQAGSTLGAMEVSSHALNQGRVAGCQFSGAIFSNMTQDHLDYHKTMEAYFQSKALLFSPPLLDEENKKIIINIDNDWGMKLSRDLHDRCWKSSLSDENIRLGKADLYLSDIEIISL